VRVRKEKKMFWNRKKKAEFNPRVFVVPEEHVLEMAELMDTYNKLPQRQDNVAKAKMWFFINNLFPETKIGSWSLAACTATTIKITEKIEESASCA
jgi:hypothetical protein